jgi:hypothetical protein
MKGKIFNTEMVQAVLKGRKTQFREITEPQPELFYVNGEQESNLNSNNIEFKVMAKGGRDYFVVPPYQIGDILYVKETWMITNPFGDYAKGNRTAEHMYKTGYAKGKRIPITKDDDKKLGVWKPSTHMSKDAARIFLKVTNVRVQRLQDINYEDLISEGMEARFMTEEALEEEFKELWNSKYHFLKGWDNNPWVWVVDFERVESPLHEENRNK